MRARLVLLQAVIIFSTFTQALAGNFTFSYGNASQCDNFSVSWTGGTAPFTLVLTPALGTPRTISIPASSVVNGKGSFHTQLPFAKDKKFVATMSDAAGFGSGGTSPILSVGQSTGGANCNTTDPGVDFLFELNTALAQCRTYTFSNYVKAQQPVTITGLIPGGQSFILNPPTGPTSFDWIADVAAGTTTMFIMTDSKGGQGGSSGIMLVGMTDDATCLNANSPASLSIIPSATSSSAPTRTSAGGGASSTKSTAADPSHTSAGVIAGAVLVSLFALGAIVVIVVFMVHRRRKQNRYNEGTMPYAPSARSRRLQSIDLGHDGQGTTPDATVSPYPYTAYSAGPDGQITAYAPGVSQSAHNLLQSQAQPYGREGYPSPGAPYAPSDAALPSPNAPYPPPPPGLSYAAGHSRPTSGSGISTTFPGSSSDWQSPSNSSGAQSKAAMAGLSMYKPARFVVHTDLEETVPPEDSEEIIELPPQYSERRAPIAGLPNASAPSTPLEYDDGRMNERLQAPIPPGSPHRQS